MEEQETLLLHAFMLCHQWSLAEDIVQESLLVAAERWQDLRDEAGILPWMRRIVQIKSLEFLRHERRKGLTTFDADVLEAISDAMASNDDNSDEPSLKAMKAALRQCMEGLSAEHQRLLDAFYWQQRSCEDLATEFGRRADNLRAILSRLRKKLMGCMEQHLAPHE